MAGETIVANLLFKRLLEKGVVKCTADIDELLPNVCHWHMDESHPTNRCFTFRKFLQSHRTKPWYDLSGLEEMAIGLAGGSARFRGPPEIRSTPRPVIKRDGAKHADFGQGLLTPKKLLYQGTADSAQIRSPDEGDLRVKLNKQDRRLTPQQANTKAPAESVGLARVSELRKVNPKPASPDLRTDSEALINGPPIAQFLEASMVCYKCRPAVSHKILITQMCQVCSTNYFRLLAKMSAEGELLVTRGPSDKGNTTTPTKRMLAMTGGQANAKEVIGYDPNVGEFIQVNFNAFPFRHQHPVRIPNSAVGLWQQAGANRCPPGPSEDTRKRKERRMRRLAGKRARWEKPMPTHGQTKAEVTPSEGDVSSNTWSECNPLNSGTPPPEETEMIECNTLMLPQEFAKTQGNPLANGRKDVQSLRKSFPLSWLKRPPQSLRQHVHPLHVKALFDGTAMGCVLIDNGATVNVLPLCVYERIGNHTKPLHQTGVNVSGFNGKVSQCLGMVPFHLRVGSYEQETVFFVIDIRPNFNALLGRDWLHKAGAIPSTLHGELVVWGNEGPEIVPGEKDIRSDTLVMYAGGVKGVEDLTIKQRYDLGDPTIGVLGESKGKFEYLVSYDTTPKAPIHPIIPSGWGDEELEGEDMSSEKELTPLERDMKEAGIGDNLLSDKPAEWKPDRLPVQEEKPNEEAAE